MKNGVTSVELPNLLSFRDLTAFHVLTVDTLLKAMVLNKIIMAIREWIDIAANIVQDWQKTFLLVSHCLFLQYNSITSPNSENKAGN